MNFLEITVTYLVVFYVAFVALLWICARKGLYDEDPRSQSEIEEMWKYFGNK